MPSRVRVDEHPWRIKRGDRLRALSATLLDTNTPVNLTTATSVGFRMKQIAPTPKVVSGACVIDDAAKGLVHFAWGATDTDTPGLYNAEFEVTWASGLKQSFPSGEYLPLEVLADLG